VCVSSVVVCLEGPKEASYWWKTIRVQ
jgi:hypothetical protein